MPNLKAAFKKNVHPTKGSNSNTYQKTKSYAEATKDHQNLHTELKITDTLLSFISNLNSFITPLITLLSSVLKALIANSKRVFAEVPRANSLLKSVLAIILCQNCLLFTKMFGPITKRLFQVV